MLPGLSTMHQVPFANREISKMGRDTFYAVYFLLHIPIALLIDCAVVIPPAFRLPLQHTLLTFHATANKDFLVLLAPLWLKAAVFIEIVFQLPLFVFGAYWLLKGKL